MPERFHESMSTEPRAQSRYAYGSSTQESRGFNDSSARCRYTVRRMMVDDLTVHERLRRARLSRGEDVASIGRRIGVGPRLLVAIEEGRFGDLPAGIYARTAIRLYAAALSFDADEVLASCHPLLPSPEDPISALARLRGLRPATPPKASAAVPEPAPAHFLPRVVAARSACPGWRLLASVTIDALAVMGLLLAAVAGTILMSGAPLSALGAAAPWVFGLLGMVLESCYFVCFGGIACATIGERLMGLRAGRRNARPIDLRAIAARALRCAVRDLRFIRRLGSWTASVIWSDTPSNTHRPPVGHPARS